MAGRSHSAPEAVRGRAPVVSEAVNQAHLDTPARRELHEDDVFVPVDPGTFAARLEAAGFGRAGVDVAGDRVRFTAVKTGS